MTPTHSVDGGAASATPLRAAWEGASSLCIRCGFCLPACPTYRLTGIETASPRGRLDLMYAAARGQLAIADIEAALDLCLGCMACRTACPSGIDFGEMLAAGRLEASARRGLGLGSRLLLVGLLPAPRLLRAVVWGLYLYQRTGLQALLRSSRLLAVLFPPLARLESRMPPLPRPRGWRRRVAQAVPLPAPGTPARGTAALLAGCVMDALFGEVHRATALVLRRNGYEVAVPDGQGCCGAMQFHAGAEEPALALARRNIAAFESAGDAPIVVNSAGCGAVMKRYGEMLAEDDGWRERARRFSARVVDVSELLARAPLADPPHEVALRVAYDDPCHLLHGQGVREPPRALLAAVRGLELIDLPEADWCCGSAGSYSLTQPEMAGRVLDRKMAHLAASGAEVVATGNPGCLLQIALGARQRGMTLRVVHPVQVLAWGYEGQGAAR